jgi:hypothetical protein
MSYKREIIRIYLHKAGKRGGSPLIGAEKEYAAQLWAAQGSVSMIGAWNTSLT